MRKILRLLMLVLMVAYGAQGWGAYVKFKGDASKGDGTSWSGNTVTGTRDGITVKLTLSGTYTFSSGKACDHRGYRSTAESFRIPNGATFTVSCETAKIVYIAFSLDNGVYSLIHDDYWDDYSNKNWKITAGDGSLKCTKESEHDDYWSQSRWQKGNDEGVNSVSFKNNNGDGRRTNILWMYVYVVKNSDAASKVTIPQPNGVSIGVNGDYRFPVSASFNITSNSGNDVYYTTNGTTPTTSSTKGTSGTVSESCVVTARTYTKFNPTDDDEYKDGDKPAGSEDVYTWYSDRKVFTRYYKRNISTTYKYTTLVYPYDLKVPENCTAATYEYNNKVAKVSKTYTAGEFIPKDTPVLVYYSTGGDREFDCINTYNNESLQENYQPGTNNLEGNNSNATNTPTSDSQYTYFGLMAPTQAQKGRGLGFGFYQFNYQGTCGAIPAYRAYLKVKKSDLKANAAKEGFSLDLNGFGDTTTGISVVPATLDGASGRQGQSAVRYNLSGQQVGPDYKGIVIVNGRKIVVK